ncbi:MAG TPA: phosphoribosylaminoimidazolesuccinocarboxamide synthase [Patescibacteria group bacterium]|nr:phosphoribosylaminoimidazolesuccinocarboxamide synthase [Patescibacteria group bacterium]
MHTVEGKTKTIRPGNREHTVLLETKDVLTAGDAAKRAEIAGISEHKTTQAANVFTLLNRRGLPTAFIERAAPNALLCHGCAMLPLELIIRRFAWGSYLKRYPEFRHDEGTPHRFDRLVTEINHKWAVVAAPAVEVPYQIPEEEARERFLRDGVWEKGIYTDPIIEFEDGRWMLFPHTEPIAGAEPLMEIAPVVHDDERREIIQGLMVPAFEILERAWCGIDTRHGPVTLVDLKIEVGRRRSDNRLVIADVIDNDSWRIWPGGNPAYQLDKQVFRDDDPLGTVAENYALVAGLTEQFLD